MLESINVSSTRTDAEALYSKYIKEGFVINSKGDTLSDIDAFTVVLRNEHKKPIDEQALPVFMAEPDDGEKVVIIPVEGKGLWGPVFGYVSLRSDMNTIYGVNFDHKGETPDWVRKSILLPLKVSFMAKSYLTMIPLFQSGWSREALPTMIFMELMPYREGL